MAAELLLALWEGLLASSAACLLVLILRRPWMRAFGAGSTPWLWALVPLALLAVWLPAPPTTVQPSWGLAPGALLTDVARAPAIARDAAPISIANAVLAAWAIGVAVSAAYFIGLQRRFRHRLGRLSTVGDKVLRAEHSDVGPAVLGLLRPRILIPADFESRYSSEEQALILAHERSHLRRGDIVANAIATVLRALYWFNPLIHLASRRLRHDHELASDADVLQAFPHARRRYADTLLNAQLAVPGLPVGCLWQSSHPLKERILMLKQTTPGRRRRLTGLAAATLIVLSGAATAWTLQPADATDPIATTMAGAGPQRNEPSYRAIHPPKYPQAAIDARQSGKVVLKVGIDTAGVPQTIDVEYASLPGVFDAAASDAVKDWLFNPAQRNDQPAAAHVLVPVCFSMDDQQPTCEAGPGALEGIYLKPPAQD